MWPLWLVEMSLQHIHKNSPRLLPKPAKFEKNPPNGYRVIRKTKCGAAGAGSSPIHKQASRKGRLIPSWRSNASRRSPWLVQTEPYSVGPKPVRGSRRVCPSCLWVCLCGNYPGDERDFVLADVEGWISQFISNGWTVTINGAGLYLPILIRYIRKSATDFAGVPWGPPD